MRKKTIEEVRQYIEGYSYKCLSTEYINSNSKLEFQCDKGHICIITWHDFLGGHRCPICYGNKKKTIEEIKEYVEKFNYKCLSDVYINNKTKLKFQCDEGHIYEAIWSSFQRGNRCLVCYIESRKKDFKEVKEHLKKLGYKCLSDNYRGTYFKLKLQCDKKHIYKTTWHSLQEGSRCPTCSGNEKKTIEEIKEYVEKFGYKCLSEEYINGCTKLEFGCKNNHIFLMTWNSFQQGTRCPYCIGVKKKTIEEVKEYIEEFGYKCLSDTYIGSKIKLRLECDRGHKYEATWCVLQQGYRCPICKIENRSGENNYNWRNYTENDRENMIFYRAETTRLSNINYVKYFYFINPNKLKRGNEYHLDHIYSVIDGFNNGIPPKIIANPYNLRILHYVENISKHSNSHMTLSQLYIFYLCFLLKQKMEGT